MSTFTSVSVLLGSVPGGVVTASGSLHVSWFLEEREFSPLEGTACTGHLGIHSLGVLGRMTAQVNSVSEGPNTEVESTASGSSVWLFPGGPQHNDSGTWLPPSRGSAIRPGVPFWLLCVWLADEKERERVRFPGRTRSGGRLGSVPQLGTAEEKEADWVSAGGQVGCGPGVAAIAGVT